MPMDVVIVVLLGLLLAAALSIVYSLRRRASYEEASKERIESIRSEVSNTFNSNLRLLSTQISSVAAAVNGQLSSMNAQLLSSASQVGERMEKSAEVVGEVKKNIAELSKAAERLYEIGRSVSGLEDILRAPKMRGGLGEYLLSQVLSQCLPPAHFTLQHTFRNGSRVDAVISLSGGLVPIDAKFPLENFRRVIEAKTSEERRAAKKRFAADCRRHIDSIASSYILPEEGTLDLALMYIPAENVYYETIIKDEEGDEPAIASYALSKRVIPVSPGSLYAYLQTVILGLKGARIGERAEEILAGLTRLKNSFEKLSSDIDTLGRHINNTKTKYDDVQMRADKFSNSLEGLHSASPLAEPEADVLGSESRPGPQ